MTLFAAGLAIPLRNDSETLQLPRPPSPDVDRRGKVVEAKLEEALKWSEATDGTEVIAYFRADYCAPCRTIESYQSLEAYLSKLAAADPSKKPNVIIAKISCGENDESSRKDADAQLIVFNEASKVGNQRITAGAVPMFVKLEKGAIVSASAVSGVPKNINEADKDAYNQTIIAILDSVRNRLPN